MDKIKSLEMVNITKKFPGVIANKDVHLKVESGEVLALLGENGAGKTTLMNILYGLYHPNSGRILINDQEVKIDSPKKALDLGIGMVHQHFMLVPSLTVTENVALGIKFKSKFSMDLDNVAQKIKLLSKKHDLNIDSSLLISDLSVGERQKVEIIKALYFNANILVLDEPTAALTPQETDDLIKWLRSVIKEGMGYIPEDRLHMGTIPGFKVKENLILKDYLRSPFSKIFLLDRTYIKDYCKSTVDEYDVRCPNINTPTHALSGGNIQKLILSRELKREPDALVASYPIRGVDIAAVQYIHEKLLEARDNDMGILLITEELDELINLSDRIAVIYEGQILDVIDTAEADKSKLGLLMAGIKEGSR